MITVTSPLLPSLDDFLPYLQDIWARKWITNNGHYHQELERALCKYLKVPYISLFTNGTLPLMCALQARCNDTFFVVERYQARVCGHRSGNLQYRRK